MLNWAAVPVPSSVAPTPAVPAKVVMIVPTLTVRVARLLVAVAGAPFTVLLATHWYWLPLIPVLAAEIDRVAVVAPL